MKFEHKTKQGSHNAIQKVDIKSEFYQEIFKRNGIIAGGFARYVIADTDIEPKDIDVFCKTPDDFKVLESWLKSIKWDRIQETEFAIAFFGNKQYKYVNYIIQLVKPRQEGNIKTYGTPEEIIDNFDFTINMAAIDSQNIYTAQSFFRDMLKRKLVFNNIHCSIGILVRLRKYLKKGFTISISEFTKIYQMWDSVEASTKKTIFDEFLKIEKEEDEESDPDERPQFKNFRRDNEQIFKIFYID